YNTRGQLIRTFKKENAEKGEFVWNGTDSNDNAVSSGIYFYKLEAGNETYIKKLILMD
ncbi:MAG TPA: T9SS type A sorting domain-containing protein, partial [Candidatus Cloacimonetes bacterium]|nr:T9SS type A sorting domain-containing protein [Candidatus Cloacimonadota bacterium]